MKKNLLWWARYYVNKFGWSIIPIMAESKEPAIQWKKYQQRKPTEEELIDWFGNGSKYNIGIVTGKISGLTVLDYDNKDYLSFAGDHGLLSTPIVETTRGGQIYTQYHQGVKTSAKLNGSPLDIRNDGGYVVAPPSIHPTGKPYIWVKGHTLALPLTELPEHFLNSKPKCEKPLAELYKGVKEGSRNDSLARLVGSWASDGLTYEECLREAQRWNEKNKPPMKTEEVERTVKSIYERHHDKQPSRQTDVLLEIAERCSLFHDETKQPYASIERKVVPIGSDDFNRYLSNEFYKIKRTPPNREAIRQILPIVEYRALEGNEITLYARVGKHGNPFYYDLGNDKVVKIDKKDWEVAEVHFPLFRRYPHQKKQVEPQRKGDINKIFEFINIKDEDLRLLLKIYLVACFIPGIVHPILYLLGSQGSGKTFASFIIKSLVDPSSVTVMSEPKEGELIQTLSHHYYINFDNLSKLPLWASDAFCRACTGMGQQKRKLYTNDDDVIYNFRRCISLNGIVDVVTRADLMDRTILINLESISEKDRRPEEFLRTEFEKAKPSILGACFDALSRAIRYKREPKQYSRLADFHLWGTKIAKALGYKEKDFVRAMENNKLRKNSEILSGNTFCRTVKEFMKDKRQWEGTMKDLFQQLKALASINSFDDYTFPGHWNKMREPLERLKPVLQSYGIEFVIDKNHRADGVHICLMNKNIAKKKSR